MTDPCATHRPFLAALADGETELVGAATLEHVSGCRSCAEEVALHGLVAEALRAGMGGVAATSEAPRTARRRPRRLAIRLAAAIALVAAVAASAGLAWATTHRGDDPVEAAVVAGRQPPVIVSNDASEIAGWCSRQSARPQPSVRLASLTPRGARMDRPDGLEIVTVYYRAASGGTVAVAWLDDRPGAAPRIDLREVAGRPVLVVTTTAAIAVVSGDAPAAALWTAAADLETPAG